MAGNKFQIKRSTVSGRTPNTTNSSNASFIDVGELAINVTDRVLYSSDGSSLITLGATGFTGSQGVQGTIGFTGSKGEIGFTGSQGPEATNALTAITVTGSDQPNITSVGTLTGLNVNGNITAGNISSNGIMSIINPTGDAILVIRSEFTAGTDSDATIVLESLPGGESGITFRNDGVTTGSIEYRSDNGFIEIDARGSGLDILTGGGSSLLIDDAGDATLYGDLTVGAGVPAGNVNVSGSVIASSFVGDGSQLTGLSSLAATISVGDVTTGAPGSNATVINTGNTNAAVFDFSIPQGFTGSQGIQGTTGFTGSQGIQGVIGFTGSQGIQGVIGFTGSKGDTGFTGSQGVIGLTGSQGIQGVIGFTGSKGDTGTTGFTGSKGDTGLTGSQGIQGIQGVIGFTGSRGFSGSVGLTGSQGVIGLTGSQGIQGVQGVIGYTGSKGDQGVIGYTGSQGNIGLTGSQGIQGTTGLTGSQGIQGVIGFTGSRGNVGFTGSQGIQGVIGFTGSRGVTGFTGSQGIQGDQGVVGFTGSKGDTGATGFTGSQGIQGVIGFTGSKGDQGVIGFTGSKGDTGTTGFTGSIGFTGSAASVTWTKKIANYTAVSGDAIIADTNGGVFTITLPATPSVGNVVTIVDGDDWGTNNLTVARNGSTIEGLTEDLTIDIGKIEVNFIYDGTTWEVFSPVALATSLSDDTTTDVTQYITMTRDTSGTYNNAYISTSKFNFNPSTGTLNATNFNSLSDIKYKKEVETITSAMDLINSINPVSFVWKETNTKSFGVIAQEIEKVLPQIIENTNGDKTVNYTQLIAILISAVQELNSQLRDITNGNIK